MPRDPQAHDHPAHTPNGGCRSGRAPDLSAGGVCAWQLPPDASGPALARSLLSTTMAALDLDHGLIDDGRLAVSETATNAHQHAQITAATPSELWISARTI